MGKYSELIKNFDKIRVYMKDFFIYGFKTRTDFEHKSLRTYDNEKRRIESWLNEFISFDMSKKGKQISISCDSAKIYENPLFNAYYSKSFTDNDIELHFFIKDILSIYNSLTVEEIADKIISEYGIYFEPQTIRIKLNEYHKEGIIDVKKVGKAYSYSLGKETLTDICKNQDSLFDMVKFFSQSGLFSVVGSNILRKYDGKNDIFLMKHNFIVHTLEDNIILEIEKAINSKKQIEILNFGRSKNLTAICGVPVKIHVSVNTGRRYLIMYLKSTKRFNSFRLDYIKNVQVLDNYDEFDKIRESYERNSVFCWGISFGDVRTEGNTEKVKMVIYADEKKEPYVIERLYREARAGIVTKTCENTYTYEADVFDAGETAAWIKSFIGRIISFSCTNENVTKRIYSDIYRMGRIYLKENE